MQNVARLGASLPPNRAIKKGAKHNISGHTAQLCSRAGAVLPASALPRLHAKEASERAVIVGDRRLPPSLPPDMRSNSQLLASEQGCQPTG